MAADNDPLALYPPPFETTEERNTRLRREQEAKAISDSIDAELEKSVISEKRGPKPIKILLLGQGESGKSTTLRNFQLMYDLKAFREERASWRAVIQLNVVKSFRSILEAITFAQKADYDEGPSTSQAAQRRSPHPTSELLSIVSRLDPLMQVEQSLIRRLTMAGSAETEATHLKPPPKPVFKEIAINSTTPWKNAFNRLVRTERTSFDSQNAIDWEDPEDPGIILHACSQDLIHIWNNPLVHELLQSQNVRLEESSGFFLDSLDRVTAARYMPTDDDILRARLKTLGVSEHRFKISTSGAIREWKIYDVGGHRSQRAAWAPYFDDMNAIIFLAPISCFDQVLEEDRKVNRLEDSFKLWTMIVSNPLLKHTNLILFLNKIDILRTKLASGIKLRDHVVSYGDRPNDVDSTTSYFRRKFAAILNERSSITRVFYCHFTTVTDTKSTKYILTNLKDMLMRQNLMKINLIT